MDRLKAVKPHVPMAVYIANMLIADILTPLIKFESN